MLGTSDHGTRAASGVGVLLRVVGAASLGYSGYLHLRIALDRPPLVADGQVSLSGLFVAQAVAVALVVVWVLVRGSVLSWLAFGAVALGSAAALVLSVYVRIPPFGPFPEVYEPVWYLDKYLAGAAAVIAGVVALLAVLSLRGRDRAGVAGRD